MIVKWRCKQCDAEGTTEVPQRLVATDVVFWLNHVVAPRVAKHHFSIAKKMHDTFDMALPVGENDTMLGRAPQDIIDKVKDTPFPESIVKPVSDSESEFFKKIKWENEQ